MEILDSNANMNDDFSSNLVMLCRKYASLQGQNALKWSQRAWLPRVHNEEIHNGLKLPIFISITTPSRSFLLPMV